jgi:phospholipase D1/2
MTNKHIAQLVSTDGKAIAAATSAPGCFIHDGVTLEKYPGLVWAGPFSEPGSGNDVDFYVTGEEYFQAVASAIASATKSIYIAGWQVNFDVELAGGKTLFQWLEKAIDAKPALRIFVMPWLSPKVGVDTGDFETMLAVFQLNAGHPPPARAFALPAIAQSDMSGGLGIGFSHHQKLVVIDDRRAFVGGIDLAYGRRDDGRFSLAANGRAGNELYNSCIPSIHELSQVEQTQYLTRAELVCACFDGFAGGVGTFATSAVAAPIAHVSDAIKPASDALRDARKVVGDWWATGDLLPEFVRRWQDIPVDAAQDVSRWAYHRFDQALKGKLEGLRATGSAHAANAAAVLLAWLNNASTEQLPAELRAGSIALIEAFTSATLSQLSHAAAGRKERYPNLGKLRKILPASGKTISPAQPRMPWHDVQCTISGPAVSDLSRNFVRRWNGIACRYEKSNTAVQQDVAALFAVFGVRPLPRPKLPRLAAPPPKAAQPKTGKSWVQVLRSAPRTLQRDEAHAEQGGAAPGQAQNNCLKAMLTAIHGAQQFIYIEGQFFQSAYGAEHLGDANDPAASPMATLTDLTALAGYERYAKRLGIYQIPLDEVPGAIRWSQVDDIQRDAKGAGAAFIRDLKVVLNNLAATKASQAMGPAQDRLLNPIGETLARRIEQAIYDKQPFHVYMLLPVHPEGALNTLNIMTQLHLTMQSLVFGSHSLVNRIRRAVLVQKLCKEDKLSIKAAQAIVGRYAIDTVVREGKNGWKEYLTLLNLRNWEILEKRPVTEQIYVHSKLLIADDRVAVLGSANINDRSQLGDRDSELAVIVRDDEALKVRLDGIHEGSVSANVHRLRTRLWKKLFGLMGSTHPATSLAPVIDKPAARDTWKAIQRVSS